MVRAVLRILAGLALLAGCAERPDQQPAPAAPTADGPVAEGSLGPVSATLRMEPRDPRFGERVQFELEIVAGPGAEVEDPEIGARLGHFRVRGKQQDHSADGRRRSYTITAEPERTGVNVCRPPVIAFKVTAGEGAGSEQELRLEPFDVEVAGLAEHERPDLADLGAPLAALPLPSGRGARSLLWLGLGGALAVAAAAGLLWWRRRRIGAAGAPVRDPGEEAAWAFDALLAMDLIAQGRFGEFYFHLTGIVRRYVERTTGIHAPEQTTEEFLREMEGHESFEPEQRRRLSAFLMAADLVKFAAQVPSSEEIDDAVGAARSFCGLGPRAPEAAA